MLSGASACLIMVVAGEVYFRRVAADYGQKTQYQEYVCDCPCRSWYVACLHLPDCILLQADSTSVNPLDV